MIADTTDRRYCYRMIGAMKEADSRMALESIRSCYYITTA